MRLSDRDQAIAVAEARVRDANVGTPQLLGAEHLASNEFSKATENRLWSLGATEAQIHKIREIVMSRPPRPAWHVQFLLRDSRYVDGVTVATVKIDDATGAPELDVFQRGGPTVA